MTIDLIFGTEAKAVGHGTRRRSDNGELMAFKPFLQIGCFEACPRSTWACLESYSTFEALKASAFGDDCNTSTQTHLQAKPALRHLRSFAISR
ncbi:uncharacterized protein FIBRA_08372 [Fibroporia radiculosa]|uniref:Uncharacterized protein n=1 Tax=Fibroporia radiculosa TaxID=599839 RepID=J4GH80_9APHY|nr:uncharacterized protein FIBRA_08372 [Fibroporia radiculosa]CCM06123.1 predicted protein [Fibroporia radiculosa]